MKKTNYFQHSGGIKALKVFSEGADGYREPLWQINDMTMEANKEWWKGQVKINDHQVGNKKLTLFQRTSSDFRSYLKFYTANKTILKMGMLQLTVYHLITAKQTLVSCFPRMQT